MRGITNEIFLKLLKVLDEGLGRRIDAKVLLESLDPDDLERLEALGIFKSSPRIKEGMVLDDRFKVTKIDKEKKIVKVVDIHNPGPPQEEPLYKYIEYEIEIQNLVRMLLNLMNEKLNFELESEQIECIESPDYFKCYVPINGRKMVFFFQFTGIIDMPTLLIDLAKNVELKRPVILVLPSNSIAKLMNFLELVAIGALAYIITFEGMAKLIEGNRKIVNDFKKRLSYIFYVLELEDKVLSGLEGEKFKEVRELLIKVDTNPKYLVTMLSLFDIAQKAKGKDSWKLFEDLVGLALCFLYGGEIFSLGYRASFENVPDSVFIVRRSKPKPGQSEVELIGIVDAKSGELELSPHDVSKYERYFELIRKYPWVSSSSTNQLVVLYFVTLNTCDEIRRKYNRSSEDKGIKGFYNRVRGLLLSNEYITILPVDSLLMLIDLYLSMIRRMMLERTFSGLHDFYRTVLRPDNDQVVTRFADRLCCIDSQKLSDFIRSMPNQDILKDLLNQ